MARAKKADLNQATREELVEAGMRPGVADAVLKRREEQGPFTSVDELTEIAGVGAASLDQLRGNLTVSRGGGYEGRQGGRDAARAGAETARAGAETMRAGAEAAGEATTRAAGAARGAAERSMEAGRETTERGMEAARGMADRGMEMAQRTGEAARRGTAEMMNQGREQLEQMTETGRRLMGDPAEFGQKWLALWTEQSSESFKTMMALGMCRSWREALDIQSEFVRSTMERFNGWAAANAERLAKITAEAPQAMAENVRANVERTNKRTG